MKKLFIGLFFSLLLLVSTASLSQAQQATSTQFPYGRPGYQTPGYDRFSYLPQSRVYIIIDDFRFMPNQIVVPRNTQVIWVNRDRAPHTVTFSFRDSGIIQRGQNFSMNFRNPGTYDYYCRLHPQMRAQVVVR